MSHNIGVKWHSCSHCDYKSKNPSRLKDQMAYKHDINVRWHVCPYCDYRSKHKSS